MSGLVRILIRERNGEITTGLMGKARMNHVFKKTLLVPNEYLNNWITNFVKKTLNDSGEYFLNENYVRKEELGLKSPYDYGMVVVDLKKNKLHSCQGFSNLKWIRIYDLFEMMEIDQEKIISLFHHSLKSGVIKKIRKFDKPKEKEDTQLFSNKEEIGMGVKNLSMGFNHNIDLGLDLELETIKIDIEELLKQKEYEFKDEDFFDISHFDGVDLYNFILCCYNHKEKNIQVMNEGQKYFKEKNINVDFDLFSFVDSFISFDSVFKIKCEDFPSEDLKKELELDGFVFSDEENNLWKEFLTK